MKIKVIKGRQLGHLFNIDKSPALGSAPGNDIVIDEPGVSREHAKFTVNEHGVCVIEDLNSTNGVRVNGEKIDIRHPLRPGDRVGLGEAILLVTDNKGNVPGDFSNAEEKQQKKRKTIIAGSVAALLLILIVAASILFYTVPSEPKPPERETEAVVDPTPEAEEPAPDLEAEPREEEPETWEWIEPEPDPPEDKETEPETDPWGLEPEFDARQRTESDPEIEETKLSAEEAQSFLRNTPIQ